MPEFSNLHIHVPVTTSKALQITRAGAAQPVLEVAGDGSLATGDGATAPFARQDPQLDVWSSAGQETITRFQATVTSAVTLSNQAMRTTYFTARSSFTSTQVRTFSGSTAAGATPTLCRVGLYIAQADGTLSSLAASIVNDTTLWASTTTAYDRSWSSPVAIVRGQRYGISCLCVTGATAPTMPGTNVIMGGSYAAETIRSPALASSIASQADLPASVAVGSLSGNTGAFYAVVMP